MQDGFIPQGAHGLILGGWSHGGSGAAGFPSTDEGVDEGLPGGMRPGGLVSVNGCLWVSVYFRPDIADVVALGAIVLVKFLASDGKDRKIGVDRPM